MILRAMGSLTRPSGTAVIALVAVVFASVTNAAERQSPEEITATITETYGVEVLRLRDVTVDGRAAYAVTVMNPGGNSNAAFQVNTLLVDAATGTLIPTFRHHASGYDRPGATTHEPDVDGTGPTMRRRSLMD